MPVEAPTTYLPRIDRTARDEETEDYIARLEDKKGDRPRLIIRTVQQSHSPGTRTTNTVKIVPVLLSRRKKARFANTITLHPHVAVQGTEFAPKRPLVLSCGGHVTPTAGFSFHFEAGKILRRALIRFISGGILLFWRKVCPRIYVSHLLRSAD